MSDYARAMEENKKLAEELKRLQAEIDRLSAPAVPEVVEKPKKRKGWF